MRIRALWVTLLVVAVSGCGTSAGSSARPATAPIQQRNLVVDGTERTYRVYQPASVDPGSAAPLVVVLHAAGETADGIATTTGFDDEAAIGRFIVVYPDGPRHTWNAGFCCEGVSTINDSLFLTRLLDQLETDYRIDRARVYLVGISAGAFMAYRLACDLSGRITAIGSVAGSLLPDTCHPSSPVSILEIHGTADTSVPYAGGPIQPAGAATAPIGSTQSLMNRWAQLDMCPGTPSTGGQAPVITLRWTGCRSGTSVALFTVQGGGHTWYAPGLGPSDGALDATSVMWSFFRDLKSGG